MFLAYSGVAEGMLSQNLSLYFSGGACSYFFVLRERAGGAAWVGRRERLNKTDVG